MIGLSQSVLVMPINVGSDSQFFYELNEIQCNGFNLISSSSKSMFVGKEKTLSSFANKRILALLVVNCPSN